jgi:Dipeptidyl aminopeptidases/acylaminoacyl-peptidases
VKIFVLPVPPTPEQSTTDPRLAAKFTTPIALTHTRAASGIQTLFTGRLLFTQSSFTSPNDVFIIRNLKRWEAEIEQSEIPVPFTGKVEQITRFTENTLKGKDMSMGEEFWFKGAHDKNVQGWVLKPKGWMAGEKKKWPVVLLIHGGELCSSPFHH